MDDDAAPEKPPVRAVPLEKVREARGLAKIPVPRSKVASTRAFRRIRADRVAGIVGVALVVAATLLLFTWPQPPVKKPPSFSVEWPLSDHTAFHDNLTLTRSQPQVERDVEIDMLNVTRVALFVRWRDDVGDETIEYDRVNFTLEGPASANVTLRIVNTANSSEFVNETAAAPVGKPPSVRDVPASTLEEALEQLGDRSDANGTGTWRLRVRVEYWGDDWHDNTTRNAVGSCPQARPEGTPLCTPDVQNLVEVAVVYRTYRAVLSPAGGG